MVFLTKMNNVMTVFLTERIGFQNVMTHVLLEPTPVAVVYLIANVSVMLKKLTAHLNHSSHWVSVENFHHRVHSILQLNRFAPHLVLVMRIVSVLAASVILQRIHANTQFYQDMIMSMENVSLVHQLHLHAQREKFNFRKHAVNHVQPERMSSMVLVSIVHLIQLLLKDRQALKVALSC